MAKSPGHFRRLLRVQSQRRLIKTPRSQLRTVTKAEREAFPEKFSPKGAYLVSKSLKKVNARTAFITKSAKQDYETGTPHTRAAVLRKERRLGYGPGGLERAVPKGVITYRLRQALKTLEFAEKPAIPNAQRRKHRAARSYRVTDEMRDAFFDLRTKKLDREFLDDGDWHEMVDMARAMNDPLLSVLLRS
jgi:hypothetical protein